MPVFVKFFSTYFSAYVIIISSTKVGNAWSYASTPPTSSQHGAWLGTGCVLML